MMEKTLAFNLAQCSHSTAEIETDPDNPQLTCKGDFLKRQVK